MTEIHSMLQRIRELTVQSVNDTNTDEDRDKIVQEVEVLGLNDLNKKYLPNYSLGLLDGAINVLSNER